MAGETDYRVDDLARRAAGHGYELQEGDRPLAYAIVNQRGEKVAEGRSVVLDDYLDLSDRAAIHGGRVQMDLAQPHLFTAYDRKGDVLAKESKGELDLIYDVADRAAKYDSDLRADPENPQRFLVVDDFGQLVTEGGRWALNSYYDGYEEVRRGFEEEMKRKRDTGLDSDMDAALDDLPVNQVAKRLGQEPRDVSLAEATDGLLPEIDGDALARWEAANPTNPFLDEIRDVKESTLSFDVFMEERSATKTQPEPFSDDWKTMVADAVAKSLGRRTDEEKEAIKLAMQDAGTKRDPFASKGGGASRRSGNDRDDPFEAKSDRGNRGPSGGFKM
ncbi:hypothetical protein BB934_45090 (plasmid) [Microvirga ossetica]|uniref:Uncharacterized protein n=1 Tax=Microvirga ossetica TaxID=1882682 RepID=A0A1B2EZN9_9HYPH|nr:hypothetical protein [Microvirga ossetica]ANY85397.1 hypothetical protein BB934_45090 [Microvirga ossetica]